MNRKSQRTKRKQVHRTKRKQVQRKPRSNKKQLRRKRRTQRKNTIKGGAIPHPPSLKSVGQFLQKPNVQNVIRRSQQANHKAKGQGVRGRQRVYKGRPGEVIIPPERDPKHGPLYRPEYSTILGAPGEVVYTGTDDDSQIQRIVPEGLYATVQKSTRSTRSTSDEPLYGTPKSSVMSNQHKAPEGEYTVIDPLE